jgi:hypothetical protein
MDFKQTIQALNNLHPRFNGRGFESHIRNPVDFNAG